MKNKTIALNNSESGSAEIFFAFFLMGIIPALTGEPKAGLLIILLGWILPKAF
jgi:hypothetical protein